MRTILRAQAAGLVVGVVHPENDWLIGPYWFRTEKPVAYTWPVKMPGAQGWFVPDISRAEVKRIGKEGR